MGNNSHGYCNSSTTCSKQANILRHTMPQGFFLVMNQFMTGATKCVPGKDSDHPGLRAIF